MKAALVASLFFCAADGFAPRRVGLKIAPRRILDRVIVKAHSTEPVKQSTVWTAPNILTASRIVMIPFMCLGWNYPALRSFLFSAAAFTDFLDGYLARKLKSTSKLGAFLDPVADKLIVAVALILLTSDWGVLIGIPTALTLARELAVSALREWMAESGERSTVAVGLLGKVKTTFQLISIYILMLLPRPLRHPLLSNLTTFAQVGVYLFFVSTAAAVVSGLIYLRAAWPALTRTERSDLP